MYPTEKRNTAAQFLPESADNLCFKGLSTLSLIWLIEMMNLLKDLELQKAPKKLSLTALNFPNTCDTIYTRKVLIQTPDVKN